MRFQPDLFDIFSSNDMAGFRATAYDADGRLFHRNFDDTIDYSAAEYGSMTECSDENGDTYYVVKEHCSWLGFDIYAAQRTAVFESSIHSVILHHVLVSLLVLFIAEVFIILSSHQLSRSILRLTRKVSQLSDPGGNSRASPAARRNAEGHEPARRGDARTGGRV